MSGLARFTLFSSAIGECALAWNDAGLRGVWLPEMRNGGLRARIDRRLRGAAEESPSAEIAAVVAGIVGLLAGDQSELSGVRIDFAPVSDFHRRVYDVARTIPAGRVLTYAAVAQRSGSGATAQAVGQALGANPFPIVVPCHRVIAANGRLGGFSAPGGTALKRRLLAIENARADGPPDLFDSGEAMSPPSL